MNDSTSPGAHAHTHDVAIDGGGLAGGLIALVLHRARPEFRICVIEGGRTLGGNHRWSWFESDLSDEGKALLEPIRQAAWDKGYEVEFPAYKRVLGTGYRSMSSHDFHEALSRLLPEDVLRRITEFADTWTVPAPAEDPALGVGAPS